MGTVGEFKVDASVATGHFGVEVVVGMAGGEFIVALENELTGHAEMNHHINIVAKFNEEHFAAAIDVCYLLIFEVVSIAKKILLRKNVDFFDGFAERTLCEAAANSFDFGKFWHEIII